MADDPAALRRAVRGGSDHLREITVGELQMVLQAGASTLSITLGCPRSSAEEVRMVEQW